MPLLRRRTLTRLGLAAPALALFPREPRAAGETVKIGAPYPLTGGAASAGTAVRQAIEVAVDIINNPHPELPNLPLATTAGLPGLGGRKVEVLFADHQGNPATAQSEALRLVTQDKVVALTGCYQSSCTLTASAIAERYGLPIYGQRILGPEPDGAWFQVVLSHDAGRHGFRRGLRRVPGGAQGRRVQGREDRLGQ